MSARGAAGLRRQTSAGMIVFSYLNPILQFGLARFCEAAVKAGLDGALVTDLPVEEAGVYLRQMRRRELATVRNQQLQLARERARLQDEELEASHALVEAVRNVDTNFALAQTNFNRRVAAERQVEAVQAAYDAGTVLLDDPALTVRLDHYQGLQPLRVIVDSEGRTPYRLAQGSYRSSYGQVGGQVQQLGDFGLEGMSLFGHGVSHEKTADEGPRPRVGDGR